MSEYIGQAVRPGINITSEAFQSNIGYQVLFGKMLRTGWLPALLQKESSFDPAVLEEINNQYPYLWHRLIHILAFGYNTGKTLHQLLDDNEERIQYSCHVGALFNLIISMYDYILDEQPVTENAGDVISSQLISGLLIGDRQAALLTIREANKTIKDPLLHLLLCSIYTWVVYTQRIYAEHKSRDEKLYPYILALFEAEKKTLQFGNDSPIEVLRTKSAGPFIAIGKFILEITPGITIGRHKLFESIVNDTGNVFWIVDDLSDVQKDLNNGMPNSILIKSKNIPVQTAMDDAVQDLTAAYERIKKNTALLCNHDGRSTDLEEYLNINIAGWLKLFE